MNNPLFGDDDSDDSSDSEQETTTKIKQEENEKDDDDDDDEDEKEFGDDDNNEANSSSAKDAAAPESTVEDNESGKKKIDSDLDEDGDKDDDDDDVEFDEDNAITGRTKNEDEIERDKEIQKAREIAEKKKFQDYTEDADMEVDNYGTENEEEPLGPPRKFSVLDIPPPVPASSKKKATMHMTKLPNIVNINPEAFDKITYEAEEEEKQYNGYVHNMIRWRYVKDPVTGELLRDERGKLKRESNTRIVKWSDGSLTLHVGTEVFEVGSMGNNTFNNNRNKNQKNPINNSKPNKTQFPGINGTAAKYIIPNHVVQRIVLLKRATINGEEDMLVLIYGT